jgi:alkylation response protein AidB-like acyl-CoA dehydrogenase
MFWAHRSEYRIDDESWYTAGLQGTGSKDLVFDNLFVAYKRLERLDAVTFGYTRGAGTVDSWIARLPFPIFFPCFMPAAALGCVDGMLEEFVKRQRVRKNVLTDARGIHNPAAYMRLAESVHEVSALTAFYKQHMEMIQRHAESGERMTESKFQEMVSPYPYITNRAIRILDRLFEASGASSMASINPMQRYWRDGHTAGLHVASDYDVSLQHYGRFLMGLPPTPDL